MGIALLRGRHFDGHDTVDAPFVAIVNETFARTFFPNEDPIGRRLKVMDAHRDRPTEIVGIIRDTRQRSLTARPEPEMYFPIMQRCWFTGQIVLRTTGDPAQFLIGDRRFLFRRYGDLQSGDRRLGAVAKSKI
jgi:hypothetical protein